MSFQNYAIDPRCLRVLQGQRINEPTPVQAKAIPPALEGRDVVAVAQTGTGKTLAFGLPALTQLANTGKGRNRMLVLTPTRELAIQVHSVLQILGKQMNLSSVAVYGGVGIQPQAQALRKGVDIVVACPGRLLDHINRGNANFNDLSMLVLDEADRMLDMGFLPDIKRILNVLPQKRQTMMFSATFPKEIAKLAQEFQHDPVRIEVTRSATPADAVRQNVYTVAQNDKMNLLTKLLKEGRVDSALVFLRTKYRTERIAKQLHQTGFKAQAIHGGRTQGQRQRALDGFRKGRYSILVATDVAARGLDISGITHVFNFDIPNSSDDYIHRIGRTARANADGDAITFVTPEDHEALGVIERTLGRNLRREDWDGAVSVRSTFQPGQTGRPGKRNQARNAHGQQGTRRKAKKGQPRYRRSA